MQSTLEVAERRPLLVGLRALPTAAAKPRLSATWPNRAAEQVVRDRPRLPVGRPKEGEARGE